MISERPKNCEICGGTLSGTGMLFYDKPSCAKIARLRDEIKELNEIETEKTETVKELAIRPVMSETIEGVEVIPPTMSEKNTTYCDLCRTRIDIFGLCACGAGGA